MKDAVEQITALIDRVWGRAVERVDVEVERQRGNDCGLHVINHAWRIMGVPFPDGEPWTRSSIHARLSTMLDLPLAEIPDDDSGVSEFDASESDGDDEGDDDGEGCEEASDDDEDAEEASEGDEEASEESDGSDEASEESE